MYESDWSIPWSTIQSPTLSICLLSWRRIVEFRVFNVHLGIIFEDEEDVRSFLRFLTEEFVLTDATDDARRDVRRVVGIHEGIWKEDTRHSSKLIPKQKY